jgi:hypothetical protein
MSFNCRMALAASAVALCAGSSFAQLRVATWNISNYSGGLESDLKTAFYADFQGRSMSPDVLMGLEMLSQTAVDNLTRFLNDGYQTATGSPNRPWVSAPYDNGPDTDDCVIYRSDKMAFVAKSLVISGGNINGAPRNVYRYDMRLAGYTGNAAQIALVPVHMKSGSSGTDQSRRQVEALAIRNNFNALNTAVPSRAYIVGGDFNIQASTQTAYGTLVNSPTLGQVVDPIKTPGNWNNNGAFRFVHTQDPATSGAAGGMDDRHDQLLISSNLVDGSGFDYVGNANIAYSTSTWNDSNHSYRAWGNDGTSYNLSITIAGNTMVGSAIAQALFNCASGLGHLPVFLDLRVPAKASTNVASIIFPDALVGDIAQQTLTVTNSADVALWTVNGVSSLKYSLALSGAGFSTPAGNFVEPIDALPADGINHVVTLSTATPGAYSGTITLSTDDPDRPSIAVPVSGNVYCPTDLTRDFEVDFGDFLAFFNCYDVGEGPGSECADLDGNPGIDFGDFLAFFNGYDAGC